MSDAGNKNSAAPATTFESALLRLEEIVGALEEGQIPLADSLAHYEEGIKLLKQCYQSLGQAERRIELLSRVDSAGGAHSEPFDDSATSLEEKAQTRSRRRSHAVESDSASSQDEIDGPGRLF
jgi:exodeoxyribonuclease VII small subunit